MNPEVPVERRERTEPISAVPRLVRAVLSCSCPRRGVPSREQPGQAEGAGVCVGDRHPPTSGLISKVMSFWRLCSTQSGRDPGCLLHPEPKDSLVTTAGTRLLGGTRGQSIHWPELDSRPFRETGLFRETETLQYGGRGRGGGNMGAPSGLVVGQRGSCGIDTAPPHR